jgi:hypothetical protein
MGKEWLQDQMTFIKYFCPLALAHLGDIKEANDDSGVLAPNGFERISRIWSNKDVTFDHIEV